MTSRRPSNATASGIEEYASQFDNQFNRLSQRESFRHYLTGLLLPLETNKHLHGLAEAVPGADVEALQHFLVDAPWSMQALNAKRLELLQRQEQTRWHGRGVLIIDETGDRKKGSHSDFVAAQYLGSVGKVDNGVVCVSSHWADEKVHYPIDVLPYVPAKRLAGGKKDPGFATKPRLAQQLIERAQVLGIAFQAVVADSFYGEHLELTDWLGEQHIPFVMALRPSHAIWQEVHDVRNPPPFSPVEAAQRLPSHAWQACQRTFANGKHGTWYAVDLQWGHYGPTEPDRLVVVTVNPITLPADQTWYLYTNIPAGQADLSEITRLYALRIWIEVFYKQAKGELGWADWQVRQGNAIQRHWHLVFCAYTLTLLHGIALAQKKYRAGRPAPLDGLSALRARLVASLD